MRSLSWTRACQLIQAKKRFLLTAHVSPEGDSVGSLLALNSLLRKLGKKVLIVSESKFPRRLNFLSCNNWHTLSELRRKPILSFDACVVVDCASKERMGKVLQLLTDNTTLINIDHHISNNRFGTVNLVDPGAAACGEIIHELFNRLKIPLSLEDAENLYVSISTDTGSFRYSNTTEKTHEIAARLLRRGINVERLNHQLYSNYTLRRVHLLTQFLKRLRLTAGGRIAWGTITRQMMRNTKTTPEDVEGFVDLLRAIKTVQIAFILVENEHGFKVSFRSKGHWDVNRIARRFKGGGHKKASGANLLGSRWQVEKEVLLAVSRECLRK